MTEFGLSEEGYHNFMLDLKAYGKASDEFGVPLDVDTEEFLGPRYGDFCKRWEQLYQELRKSQ